MATVAVRGLRCGSEDVLERLAGPERSVILAYGEEGEVDG